MSDEEAAAMLVGRTVVAAVLTDDDNLLTLTLNNGSRVTVRGCAHDEAWLAVNFELMSAEDAWHQRLVEEFGEIV